MASVSWGEGVGHGDLRLGSDKSVFDEYHELKHSWGFDFKCPN